MSLGLNFTMLLCKFINYTTMYRNGIYYHWCKVLHMGQGNLKYQYRLWDEWIKTSPEDNEMKIWQEKNWTLASPETQLYPQLPKKQHSQQVKGGDLSLYTAFVRPTWSTTSRSRASSTRKKTCKSGSRGGI